MCQSLLSKKVEHQPEHRFSDFLCLANAPLCGPLKERGLIGPKVFWVSLSSLTRPAYVGFYEFISKVELDFLIGGPHGKLLPHIPPGNRIDHTFHHAVKIR